MLLAGGLVTAVLTMAALIYGIGYSGSVNLQSTTVLADRNVLCTGNVSMSYNPLFYFISYCSNSSLAGGQISQNFSLISHSYTNLHVRFNQYYGTRYPHIPSQAEVQEVLTGMLAWSEVQKNLPYLLIFGFLVGLVIIESVQTVQNKIIKHRKAKGPQFKVEDAWTS